MNTRFHEALIRYYHLPYLNDSFAISFRCVRSASVVAAMRSAAHLPPSAYTPISVLVESPCVRGKIRCAVFGLRLCVGVGAWHSRRLYVNTGSIVCDCFEDRASLLLFTTYHNRICSSFKP